MQQLSDRVAIRWPLVVGSISGIAAALAWQLQGTPRVVATLVASAAALVAIVLTAGVARGRTVSFRWLSDHPVPIQQLVIVGGLATAGLVHSVAGMFMSIPSWKMFGYVPRYDYEMQDGSGQTIRLHDHVPDRAYVIMSPVFVRRMATWLARTDPDRLPLTGQWRELKGNEIRVTRFSVKRGSDGHLRLSMWNPEAPPAQETRP